MRSMFERALIPALLFSAVACKSPVAEPPPAPAPPATKVQLLHMVVQLSKMKSLSSQAAAELLGTRLGPEQRNGPAVSEWPLEPNALLLAGGTVAKIGRHMDITFRPRPSLGLTFNDVARSFLDVPYKVDVPKPIFDDPEAMVAESRKAPHKFRVPAGELQVSLGPASSSGGRPVLSITVTDEIYPEWQTTDTLREIWAAQETQDLPSQPIPGTELEGARMPEQILPE